MIKFEDFDFDNISIDEKSNENTLIYDISYKTLRIRFDKINGSIRVYDGTRYLVLFGPENYDAIYNRVRSFICQKSGITYAFSYNVGKIKVDSYDSLPIKKH